MVKVRAYKLRMLKDLGKLKIGDIYEVSNPRQMVENGDAEFTSQVDADYIKNKVDVENEKVEKKKAREFIKRDKIITAMEEKNKFYTSCIIDKEKKILVEQIWDKDNGSRFCIYDDNTKEIKYIKEYQDGIKRYVPNEGEEIEQKSVIFPSGAIEYVSDNELDIQILKFVDKWLEVPEQIRKLGLWNTKKSYVYDLFKTTNYLRIRGDLGMGKSRFLDVWGYISYRPLITTGSVSPSPLFRMITKYKGTLVMDEADLKQSDASDEVIKVLNQGYEKGKFIWRCDPDKISDIKTFDPFCPKIIATRLAFVDKATESRCITHIAEPLQNKSIPSETDDSFYKEAEEIRNKLLMWRFRNFFNIKIDVKIDLGDLEPRVKQLVNGFGVIFSKDEVEMEIFKEWIMEYQKDLIVERQDSLAGEILEALHSLILSGGKYFTNQMIIDEGKIKDYNGKDMNPKKLTSQLRSLGFGKNIWMKEEGKSKRCIQLKKKHLNPLFKRYGFEEINIDFDNGLKEKGHDRHDRHDTQSPSIQSDKLNDFDENKDFGDDIPDFEVENA